MEAEERRTQAGESEALAVPWRVPGILGDVRIWRLDLNLEAPLPKPLPALLDAAERARMDRFQRHEDKVRFGVTRAMLRRLLARHAMPPWEDAGDPSSIPLTCTDTGRPVWPGSGLYFNVAHSGALALIAISDRRPVGIDVELRKDLDVDALAAIVLTPRERRLLEQSPPDTRRDEFYRYWVCKEAALKAVGRGIADALQRVEVRADTAAPDARDDTARDDSVRSDGAAGDARFIHCEDAGMADRDLLRSLTLRLLPLADGYAGAVAWGPDARYP